MAIGQTRVCVAFPASPRCDHVDLTANLAALLACGGNRTQTAERLGISRRQLFDKIREYDLHP